MLIMTTTLTATSMSTAEQRLRLMQLASSNLPVGGYSWSQGLEWAVEAGWVADTAAFERWQLRQMEQSFFTVDLPLFARLYRACEAGDLACARRWTAYLLACRETRELPQIELVKMMLGRELEHNALQRAGRTLLSDKPVAAFEDFGKKGTIAPFSLQVRPGEIVGLAGLLGSGRTETAEVIFGIKPADSGKAWIKGKPQTLRSPHQASCLGIGFCPEDRKTDGIIAAASVRENIVLALQAQRGWLRPIGRREQNEIAERFIRQLGIRTPSAEQPIEFLSGGNQQKVLLSRWLLTKPQFLILDEPTRGIDVGAHAEIIRLIETLCADGLALLVISSELEELVGYADRVIIMRDRQQVAELALSELSVPAIMNAIAA